MILGDWSPSPCRRHREALLEFVERRPTTRSPEAALAHLDACPRCREELSETLLAITALRRMAAEARRARPPEDVWTRIRVRIDRPRAPAWVARVSMGSLIVASAVAALLLAPATWSVPGATLQEAGTDPAAMQHQTRSIIVNEARTESRFIASRLPGPSGPGVWRGTAPKVDPNTARDTVSPDLADLAVLVPAVRVE